MRENPSQRMVKVKRSFFPKEQKAVPLGQGIEAWKGAYASLRTVTTGLGQNASLSVTVDVSNTCFWIPLPLTIAMKDLVGSPDVPQLSARLDCEPGKKWPVFKPLLRLRVHTRHIEKTIEKNEVDQSFIIHSFSDKNAKTHTFIYEGKQITTQKYFMVKYKYNLSHPNLPLVKVIEYVHAYALYSILTKL